MWVLVFLKSICAWDKSLVDFQYMDRGRRTIYSRRKGMNPCLFHTQLLVNSNRSRGRRILNSKPKWSFKHIGVRQSAIWFTIVKLSVLKPSHSHSNRSEKAVDLDLVLKTRTHWIFYVRLEFVSRCPESKVSFLETVSKWRLPKQRLIHNNGSTRQAIND